MVSNGSNRSGILTAGGVLSIVGGALQVIGALIIGVLTMGIRILDRLVHIPFQPGDWGGHVIPFIPFWFIVVGLPLLVLGIVAIVGGTSALGRRRFGLSLAGAICALPSNILGILAIVFVSVSKKEFEEAE
jgi:uncharacterized membrane-anchored protein YitT (DUF2179 family)